MTFSISFGEPRPGERARGEIVLGEHRESFPLMTTFWTCEMYRAQWMNALQSLVNQQVEKCILITDIQPIEESAGISYWALFRQGDSVYVQERFSRERPAQLIGEARVAESFIDERIRGTPEEHAEVSEWMLSMSDISRFLRHETLG